ncbi:hypothetical protein ACOMHN_034329 [Nucella lapillus]
MMLKQHGIDHLFNTLSHRTQTKGITSPDKVLSLINSVLRLPLLWMKTLISLNIPITTIKKRIKDFKLQTEIAHDILEIPITTIKKRIEDLKLPTEIADGFLEIRRKVEKMLCPPRTPGDIAKDIVLIVNSEEPYPDTDSPLSTVLQSLAMAAECLTFHHQERVLATLETHCANVLLKYPETTLESSEILIRTVCCKYTTGFLRVECLETIDEIVDLRNERRAATSESVSEVEQGFGYFSTETLASSDWDFAHKEQ